jgi:hypothetical protein
VTVPATTPIKRNRAGNIDTDRLLRRRHFLIGLLIIDGGRSLATRMDFAMRAAEFTAINNVLVSRHVLPHDHMDIMVRPCAMS